MWLLSLYFLSLVIVLSYCVEVAAYDASCPCRSTAQLTGLYHLSFGGYVISLGDGLSQAVPDEYGLKECRAWDSNLSICTSANHSFCGQSWCYVDASKCSTSKFTYQASTANPGSYFSYSTCGSGDGFFGLARADKLIQSISGKTLRVAVPTSVYGRHYRLDKDGRIVHGYEANIQNGVGPYKGYDIDYFELVAQRLNFKIEYQTVSGGCKAKYDSLYIACVCGVQRGLADLCVSVMWSTALRLEMAHFTTGIAAQNFRLLIRSKGDEDTSFWDNLGKAFKPFTGTCWFLIISIVAIVGVLLTAFNGGLFPSDGQYSCYNMLLRIVNAMRDAEISFFSQGASGSEQETGDLKILRLGFSWFILTVMAAYTANLAAFFMQEHRAFPVRHIDDCQKLHCRLCVMDVVGSSLPETIQSIYGNEITYVKSEQVPNSQVGMEWSASQLKSRQCDAAIAPESFNEQDGKDSVWDGCDIIFTGEVLIFYFLASAVNAEYSPAIDWAIRSIGPSGLNQFYEKARGPYMKEHDCPTHLERTSSDDLKSLNIEDLVGSVFPLVVTVLIAFVYHTVAHFVGRKRIMKAKVEIDDESPSSDSLIGRLQRIECLLESNGPRSAASTSSASDVCEFFKKSSQADEQFYQKSLSQHLDTQARLEQLEKQVGSLRTVMFAKNHPEGVVEMIRPILQE